MTTSQIPKLLNLPEKLQPVLTDFNKYRYFLIEGGRGSGKSHSIARLILFLCEKHKLRVVCGREFQNSIEESVYTIFKDIIMADKLSFNVQLNKITSQEKDSDIRFRGFREQGSTNIKGLEGVDILWVDEAQAITKKTLDVIIPTIRKPKSKVFWTMNRHVEGDPVYDEFVNRPDCLHIKINYHENPHCPQVLLREAQICKQRSEKDYNHIWMGLPLAKGDNYLFSMDMIRESIAKSYEKPGVRKRVLANDVSRYGKCENVFTVLESRGPVFWEQIHMEYFTQLGLDETVGKHLSLKNTMNLDVNVIDDDGMGGGVTDNLRGIDVIPFRSLKDYESESYTDRRTDAYFQLQEMLMRGHIKILNDPVLHEQLLTIKYRYSASNGKKKLWSKDEMLKEQIDSPDRADALAMAVFYRDWVLDPRNTQKNSYDSSMDINIGKDNESHEDLPRHYSTNATDG